MNEWVNQWMSKSMNEWILVISDELKWWIKVHDNEFNRWVWDYAEMRICWDDERSDEWYAWDYTDLCSPCEGWLPSECRVWVWDMNMR